MRQISTINKKRTKIDLPHLCRSMAGTAAALCLGAGLSAQAGTNTFDFSSDPSGILDIVGNGYWMDTGGNPGGFLRITESLDSQKSTIFFDDFDNGAIIGAFTFSCDLRVGDGTADPADGFSINYARENDPALTSHDGNNFAGRPDGGEANLPEEGTQTGIAVGFDAWQSGDTAMAHGLPDGDVNWDTIGISVRVDNKVMAQIPMRTKNGAPTDATSMQTGPRSTDNPGSGDQLTWQPLKVQLDDQARLSVWWKNVQIVTNLQTDYFPSRGRLIFTGRTGGSYQMTDVDNIKVVTYPAEGDTTPPTTPANFRVVQAGAGRVALAWDASTDDGGRVSYTVSRNGTAVSGVLQTNVFEDRGVNLNSTYTYTVRASDVAGNTSADATVSATTVGDVAGSGFLKAEIFTGINGVSISDLLAADKYISNTPDRVAYLLGLSFGEWTNFGDTYGDNYGLRITGTITVPETAQYDFFVRSDDASAFYLNTASATLPDPNTAEPIAQETDCCEAFVDMNTVNDDGATYAMTTTPISLQANKTYGFVYLVKEGGGGDWGQVAWRKVGDTTAPASLQPIRGLILKGSGDPIGSTVAITEQPQSVTTVANERVSLKVKATSQSPYGSTPMYQWYKNGNLIAGATTASYTLPVAAAADNGAKFTVVVGVMGTNVTSSEAVLTVNADNKLPTIVSTMGDDSFTKVTLTFSEPVTTPSATTASNYTFSDGVTVSAAELVDQFTVRLTTSKQVDGKEYTITVNNVKDNAGNSVAADTQVKYNSWSLKPGFARMEQFNGISNTDIASLLNDPKYQANTPDAVRYLQGLTTGSNTGENFGDNYGAKILAYLVPTVTTNYHFFIRSDDASELYLSQNETFPVPGTDTPIVQETDCCEGFVDSTVLNDDGTTHASTTTPIALQAGQKYAMVVLMKEGGGGDFVQLAWRMAAANDPNTNSTSGLTPIANHIQWFAPTYANVLKPGDPIVASSANSPASGNENAPMAIDGKTNTKYLNFDKLNTGFTVTPSAGATILKGIALTSANDAIARDPATYRIEGSNDGTTFTVIAQGDVTPYFDRFERREIQFTGNTAAYTSYRVIFPAVRDGVAANSMQIAEVELLGVVVGGGATTAPKLSFSKTGTDLVVTFEGSLESADAVNGPWTPVTGASPLTVTPNGTKFYRAKR